MNHQLKNKIEATNTNINSLLKDQKFYIDYFQREYRWGRKHIQLLIEDLTTTFLKSFNSTDKRSEVANYQSYYLGPVVFSVNTDDGKKSIIDGQQRITSISLFLIYLNHLQKNNSSSIVSINELIYSEKYGEKSFNMTDEAREPCLKNLFENGSYSVTENDDETIQNMVNRYEDIAQSFPDEINNAALPYFIDWLINNVVIVAITAYSDENAYTIFETMNDRGLNLTPTEMLKGYILSKISDNKKRTEINELWKDQIQNLHNYADHADLSFFQSWFRGKYALTMRSGNAGSINQDFELIGSRFHNWFKDNHVDLFNLRTSDEFYDFFKNQFPYFVKLYLKIKSAQAKLDSSIPHLHYICFWGIAESLQEPLLFSSINYGDNEQIANNKLDFVARFIETFTVRRSVNYKKFGQTSIKYSMFNIIKKIRNKDLQNLSETLINESRQIEQKWDGVIGFGLHGQNKKFIKHLLSRITSHIDNLIGKSTTYVTYHHPAGRQFEIEHLWGNKFEEHRDEFDQQADFNFWRNAIGALILLPNGTNQSFSSSVYEDKLEHYIKENAYAQSLNEKFYEKNPNFLNVDKINELEFRAYPKLKKADIKERQELVRRICEQIWSTNYFSVGEKT